MAQTVIVAAGTTAASSTTQTIASGASATFVIYAASGGVQPDMSAEIAYDTPGGDVGVSCLSVSVPAVQIQGPAQVIVKKSASAASCGVLIET